MNIGYNCYIIFLVPVDTQPPTLTGCTTSQGPFTAANGATNLAVPFTEPTFGNDFPDVPIVTKSHVPGDAFVDGTTTVNYTATDLAGNVNNCFMEITVISMCEVLWKCEQNGML